jgi:hypothetical protein
VVQIFVRFFLELNSLVDCGTGEVLLILQRDCCFTSCEFGYLLLGSWRIVSSLSLGIGVILLIPGGRLLCCMLFVWLSFECHYVGWDAGWRRIYEAEAQPGVCIKW